MVSQRSTHRKMFATNDAFCSAPSWRRWVALTARHLRRNGREGGNEFFLLLGQDYYPRRHWQNDYACGRWVIKSGTGSSIDIGLIIGSLSPTKILAIKGWPVCVGNDDRWWGRQPLSESPKVYFEWIPLNFSLTCWSLFWSIAINFTD